MESYTYDGVNRLTGASETGAGSWSESYGYDAQGNRWLSGYSGGHAAGGKLVFVEQPDQRVDVR
ncbi:MAG: hypothetical protein ACRD30_00370 [Bryobacteraceae bacterium]